MTHRCPLYVNARGEVIDPADQDGIGCPDHPSHAERDSALSLDKGQERA